jgi:hypothetical protein
VLLLKSISFFLGTNLLYAKRWAQSILLSSDTRETAFGNSDLLTWRKLRFNIFNEKSTP